MENKDQNPRKIKVEQLMQKEPFLTFCNSDPASIHGSGRMRISVEFLDAAQKDNLIRPLVYRKKKAQKVNNFGDYYSPHQIYLLSELRYNVVEDGRLRADNYSPSSSVSDRMIEWGQGMEFNMENIPVHETGPACLHPIQLADQLHSFLKLLHSLDASEPPMFSRDRKRYWASSPLLEYDFEPIKLGGTPLLMEYGIDENKLAILRKKIAEFGNEIDPLGNWYYYAKRHPEWKRDLLKGDASLAQEIYRLYDLVTEAWEAATQSKAEPLMELLYEDLGGMLFSLSKKEHLQGTDTRALQHSVEKFKGWIKAKENKKFVSKDEDKRINSLEREVAGFVERYGHKNYAGNIRVVEEGDPSLEKLDNKAKAHAEMALEQKDAASEDDKRQAVSLAIWLRLDELQREIRQIFHDIMGKIQAKEQEAQQKLHDLGGIWWDKNREKLEPLTREEQLRMNWAERDELEEEVEDWQGKVDVFKKDVLFFTDVAFCSSCEEKPVSIHVEHPFRTPNDSSSHICDDCLDKVGQGCLAAKDEWWKETNQAEWRCKCGQMLYKFAYGNMLSAKTRNNVPVKMEINYGNATIQAKCPKCSKTSERLINWGWLA